MREAGEPLEISMDGEFVQNYMGLDESSAEQVTEALRHTPISAIRLYSMAVPVNVNNPTRASVRRLALLNQLCTALGSIESMKKAYCFVQGRARISIHCHLLPHLQQLSSLFVFADESHPSRIAEVARLVAGLEANPNLKKLVLKVSLPFYATVLPALRCKPVMEMVFLASPMDDMETVTRVQAQAMADFLMRDLPFSVKLDGYDFSEHDCSSILCNGIAASKVYGFGLERCCLGEDMALLARSLTQSRLQSLAFIKYPQDDLISLLRELVPEIANMAQLQEFVCERPLVGEYSSVDLTDLLVRLVEALAHCVHLKVAELASPHMTTDLEQALVKLISKKASCLEELQINCSAIPRSSMPSESPDLLEAIKSNYTLRKLELLSPYDKRTLQEKFPWSTGLRENVGYLMRLNNAGRSYLVTDPCNKQKGFALLEQANDSLDCLLLHLKENPFLCQREKATDVIATGASPDPQKRAASPALDSVAAKRLKSSWHIRS